jgi:hypothetical protein
MALERTFLEVRVSETDKDRNYWATRPWLTKANEARAADILVIPWENFRDNKPALFPEGTSDFYRELKDLPGRRVVVAIDEDKYQEIALHADARRFASLFVTAVALPLVISLLAAKADHWLSEPTPVNIVELEVVVENEWGRCLSIKYKGPPSEVVETLSREVKNCLPKLEHDGKSKGKVR